MSTTEAKVPKFSVLNHVTAVPVPPVDTLQRHRLEYSFPKHFVRITSVFPQKLPQNVVLVPSNPCLHR
jgi:hypothetical protein